MSRVLVLFMRDLRLADQAALAEAARYGKIVPVCVIDDEFRRRYAGSPRRAAYVCAALGALDVSLRERGTRLVVRRGPLAAALLGLARATGAATVLWSHAYDRAGATTLGALQADLEEANLRAYGVHDAPAVAPEETAAARSSDDGAGYRALAPYLAAWRTLPRSPLRVPLVFAELDAELRTEALPTARELAGADAATPAGAGESVARRSLAHYLAGAALQYNVASRVPAGEPTARLSAPLSFGVISARTVLAMIDERLAEPFLLAEERVALRSLQTSLAERDFFLQLAHFFERRPDEPLRATARERAFDSGHPLLPDWLEGRTGYPLVDAGMRQLHATGWMHPHVRRVAASFLCFDLGVDWRVGRDAWERHLEEDDLALANGNWQWSAGVGADLAAVPRIFNPRKQLRCFDPAATYVRRYLPELAQIPPNEIFGDASAVRTQLALPLFGARAYPSPVVEHERVARAFLARYASVAAGR